MTPETFISKLSVLRKRREIIEKEENELIQRFQNSNHSDKPRHDSCIQAKAEEILSKHYNK